MTVNRTPPFQLEKFEVVERQTTLDACSEDEVRATGTIEFIGVIQAIEAVGVLKSQHTWGQVDCKAVGWYTFVGHHTRFSGS